MHTSDSVTAQIDLLRQCDKELLDACSKLDLPSVLDAIAAGANVNVEYDGCTPMFNTMFGDIPIAAEADEEDDDDFVSEEEDCISDEEVYADIEKADQQRIKVFEILIAHGADINKIPKGEYELLWHAVHCSPFVVEFLLKNGADPNLVSDEHSEGFVDSPLAHACTDECIHRYDERIAADLSKIQRLLLAYGARPN